MLKRTRTASMLLAGALALGSWATADDDQAPKKKAGAGKEAWEAAPLTEAQRVEIADLFAGLMKLGRARLVSAATEAEPCCEAGAPCPSCETYSANTKSLVKWLTKSPEAWEVVTPLLTDAFVAEDATPVLRDTMLGLLGWTKSKHAIAVGDALWERGAQYFTQDHVLAFAENGNQTLFAECEKLAAEAGRDGVGIRPAALVALRSGYGAWGKKAKAAGYGGKAGYADEGKAGYPDEQKKKQKKQLARVAKALGAAIEVSRVDVASAPDVLLAGFALDRLGDSEAWDRARTRVHSAVIAALDAGQLERARRMCLQAEFFDIAASSREPLQVSYMDERLRVHHGERSKEVATADQVFDLIERITPL